MLTSIGAMKHGKKKKFSGERELRTGKHPQGAASRGHGRAALPDHPASWHEQRYPPPKGIDEQPLAVSCGEIRNMHMGARYAAAVDTGVNQPCHRPKAIAASNADCKLPLASPNPLSVAVAGPSARLLTQREI